MVAADPQKMPVAGLRRCLIAFVPVGGHRFSPCPKGANSNVASETGPAA